MEYAAKFYTCAECQTWYRDYIATLVKHTNPYNGMMYRDDPTIFFWELANGPRRYPAAQIDDTAAYIKSLDPNHLVTTGSEGTPPGELIDFTETHNGSNIDYATIHIWLRTGGGMMQRIYPHTNLPKYRRSCTFRIFSRMLQPWESL